ncbi:MAG TPA: type II toxin-antitoxin system VapC family toxin [Terriglobales bacterium]|nr:type II toxin-antitoxin system VapC family toxin [Terriglobales bacterium]
MKLLLDTHIWLWALGNPEKLSKKIRRELENPANEIWVSAVSAWEALMLHSKRRIQLPEDLEGWFRRATSRNREAPLTHEIVFQAHNLALPHKDPADRFLAATAKVLDLVLVTQDPELLGLGDIQTLANR